jgi:hypothetical protein
VLTRAIIFATFQVKVAIPESGDGNESIGDLVSWPVLEIIFLCKDIFLQKFLESSNVVKILFGWIFKVIHKSYRQVLTPVHNSQLLLKLKILDKFRLVTFHKIQHKETATL